MRQVAGVRGTALSFGEEERECQRSSLSPMWQIEDSPVQMMCVSAVAPGYQPSAAQVMLEEACYCSFFLNRIMACCRCITRKIP